MRAFCFVACACTSQRLKNHDIALSWKERGIDMTNKPIAADVKPDHEESHDEWFRRQVQKALDDASRPDAVWHSHDDVVARGRIRRAEILERMRKDSTN
jgi:hypothetical protein